VRHAHLRRWTPALLLVLALAPLAASVAAVAPDWVPVGDDATVAMRGRDLLGTDAPLVGMPSAVGEQTDRPVHHPGPLQLWWVGVVTLAVGGVHAPLVAAALAWAAAVTVTLALARRLGGAGLMALAATVAAALTWSLRGEVPVTPFNTHAIVVPLAGYLLALAAWHRRVPWAPVAAVVLGSWAAQAHLTAVGPVLAGAAILALAGVLRRRHEPAPLDRRRIAVAAGALLACWVGPMLDVVLERGGNVRAVLGARADLASEAIGLDRAADIVVRALAWRPVWAEAGAHPTELVRPAGVAHWIVAAVVVAVAVAGAVRWRRERPELGVLVSATLLAVVVGAVLAARFPGEYLSLLALHNHLWLWPLTAVLWGAAAVAVGLEGTRRLADRTPAWAEAVPVAGLAVSVATLAALALASVGEPHRNLNLAGPTYVRALAGPAPSGLDPDRSYRLVISGEFDAFFVEVGVMALLEHRGIEVVGPERYRRAFGDGRTDPVRPPGGELHVVLGWEPPPTAPGGRTLSRHRPSDALLAARSAAEDALVGRMRSVLATPGEPLFWALGSTDEPELRRWAREDLHGLVVAGMVPEDLAVAPETRRYLALRRQPARHAALHLLPAARAGDPHFGAPGDDG
jgi:hypothetical protein